MLGNPVSVADFTKAMNFPDSPDDKEGFRALRRALDDRGIAKLIRAAQDVLTLLSQDGIYMDDLKPDRARPDIWRRFAQGERGRVIASLGGVRDRSSLALTASRMRQDTIFRDAAHHFLRQFDRTFAEFEANAHGCGNRGARRNPHGTGLHAARAGDGYIRLAFRCRHDRTRPDANSL